MLDTIPHDQAFTQPIIAQLVTYYDKCRGFYKCELEPSQTRFRLSVLISPSTRDPSTIPGRARHPAESGCRLERKR